MLYLVSNHLDEYERVIDFDIQGVFDTFEDAKEFIDKHPSDAGYFAVWGFNCEARVWKFDSVSYFDRKKHTWVAST